MIQNACSSVRRDVTESTYAYTKQQTHREPESADQNLVSFARGFGAHRSFSVAVRLQRLYRDRTDYLGTGSQPRVLDVHLFLHTAPEICSGPFDWLIQWSFTSTETVRAIHGRVASPESRTSTSSFTQLLKSVRALLIG